MDEDLRQRNTPPLALDYAQPGLVPRERLFPLILTIAGCAAGLLLGASLLVFPAITLIQSWLNPLDHISSSDVGYLAAAMVLGFVGSFAPLLMLRSAVRSLRRLPPGMSRGS